VEEHGSKASARKAKADSSLGHDSGILRLVRSGDQALLDEGCRYSRFLLFPIANVSSQLGKSLRPDLRLAFRLPLTRANVKPI